MSFIANRPSRCGSLRKFGLTAPLTAMTQFSFAESEYAAAWGPAIGSAAPLLSASDQNGQIQNLNTLMGANG